MELVGRERELAALTGAIAPEGSSLLAVSGEPGIGKSRLLAELADRYRVEQAVVLSGRAAEFESDVPFAVWADALDDHLARDGHAEVAQLDDDAVGELGAILPSLRVAGAELARPADDRHRAHSAIRALLEIVARSRQVLLILDDLHWADESSIDLVASLLRRPPNARVTLAVAFRSGQASEKLVAALDRAERDGVLTWVIPEPLDGPAMQRMMGRALPPHLREQVERESGGNPFYVESLSRSAATAGAVPRTVGDAVSEELRVLGTETRAVLVAAATVGDPFDPDLVAAAAELDESAVLDALDTLRAHDLVRPAPASGRFTMRHPLVRRAVYAMAGSGWRLAAHRRIAAELAARGAGPAARAHHVALYARPGDDDAVTVLADAARAVLAGAPDAAASWLESAIGLLEERPGDSRTVGMLMDLSRARMARGDMPGSREALLTALAGVSSQAERLRLSLACAQAERRMGRADLSRDRLATLLDSLPPGPSPERTALLVQQAENAFFEVDGAGLVEHTDLALTDARHPEDTGAIAVVLALRMAAHAVHGLPGVADDADRLAVNAFDALDDEALATGLPAAVYLTQGLLYAGSFSQCLEVARRGIRVARGARQEGLVPELTLAEGTALTMLGRLDEAQRVLEAGLEAARVAANPASISWVLANLSLAQMAAGRPDEALRSGEESFECAVGNDGLRALPAFMVAAALFALGETSRARDLVLAECGGPGNEFVPGFGRCSTLETLVRMELALGNRVAAEDAVLACERHADDLALPLTQGWALRARAVLEGSAGLAEQAAESFAASHVPVEQATSLVLAGRAHAGAEARDRAVGALERAAALAEECGAALVRDDAVRELRRLGRRRAVQPTAEGIDALSDRERDVADLVRAGQTNAEIAAGLFLSVKTVESHIRNMFRKLDVSSRAEIARMLDRTGS